MGLQVDHVSKRFGATIALRGFSIAFEPGRVYAILGENGCGKSTLVKILSGVLKPDHGSVRIGDRKLARYSPAESIACGIATAYQEILVAKNLTVLESLFLWDTGWPKGSVSASDRRKMAAATLAELCENPPPLDIPVGRLSLAAQQAVVVARAALQPSSIVILDEATSALDAYDAERLLKWMKKRASEGGTVLFISHRLGEVTAVADDVVILREGSLVGRLGRDSFTPQAALALMSPERTEDIAAPQPAQPPAPGRQPPAPGRLPELQDERGRQLATAGEASRIRAVGVVLQPGAQAIDLELYSGEVTGFAGLDGHGQAEFLKHLSGWSKPQEGRIELIDDANQEHVITNPRAAAALGVAYVPRDRKADGILPSRSVFENFAVAMWGENAVAGVLRPGRLRAEYERLVTLLSIKSSGPRARITSLSGGAQQKVIVARWLARKPRILLLDDPTRGVDQRTKVDLYETLRETASEGRAVVVVSTDVEELASLCDRVVVFYRGHVTADFRREPDVNLKTEAIVEAMFTEKGDADVGAS